MARSGRPDRWEDKAFIEIEDFKAASLDELAAFQSMCLLTAKFIRPSPTEAFLKATFDELFANAQRGLPAETRVGELVLTAQFEAGKTGHALSQSRGIIAATTR